ncbi:ABC transporter ATP-binding protein [Aquabacter spiritensis]|uniref:NitT/TauT family transport system ATP-binding protein n=1 Tax=Aquabacter spiritensis TaxID=933073 RepID=A0A4R3M002_9HYPH|nr:ABC transporter ATP-binding protein [Aquabacter spiritensis]TCT04385.1 NitT/TauT family transport system ATP-binding protein [Aquabacter spiritensis]
MMAAGARETVISLSGVTKAFEGNAGHLVALKDIGLDLYAGEVLALVGPSGCGKSTLLNIVAGIQSADHGTVTVFGKTPGKDGSTALGYVFQEDRLLPWRTALRNVTFSLEAGSVLRSERDRRAREALALVGLAGFEASYPHQLSGGMRSRVALARSLVLDPPVLLMDEPFGRLDAMTRSQMHGELLRLKGLFGMSILFVTHDVDEAVALADRVIVLQPRPGRISTVLDVDLPRPRDTAGPEGAAVVSRLKSLIGS